MAYTDTGLGAGRIYDSNEIVRLNDFANEFDNMAEKSEKIDTKTKDVIRYFIIGGCTLLILTLLKLAVKRKK